MKYIEEKSRSGIVHKKYTSDFGKKILEKFGWNEYEYITYIYIYNYLLLYNLLICSGEGLGKNKTGIKEVIQIKRREENKGLGKETKTPNWNDKWWENTYDKVLQSIKHNENENDDDDDDISSQDTQAEIKKNKQNTKQHKQHKPKLSKIEKEVTLLNKKRKITFISI